MIGGGKLSDGQIEVLAVKLAQEGNRRDVSLLRITELTGRPFEDIIRILSNSTYGLIDTRNTASVTDDSFYLTQQDQVIEVLLTTTFSKKEKQNIAEDISNRNDRLEKEKGGLGFNPPIPGEDPVLRNQEKVKDGLGFVPPPPGGGPLDGPVYKF